MNSELVEQLDAALHAAVPAAYCRLVETRGSTPQKAGATMLVFPDGRQAGTLGGGCVEAEVKRRAIAATASGEPEVAVFQLDSDYGWDDGLICGGRMKVLIQPIQPSSGESSTSSTSSPPAATASTAASPASPAASKPGNDDQAKDDQAEHQQADGSSDVLEYFRQLARVAASPEGGTEAVVYESDSLPAPASILFNAAGNVVHQLGVDGPLDVVRHYLKPIGDRPRPYAEQGIAYLPWLPRCRLVIVGGGHVGQAVAGLAAQLDFDVWVVDDREEYVSESRFPFAQRRIHGGIDATLPGLEVTSDTYCLIVTRGHSHDEQALFHLAERGARYVGLIGSRRKIRMIFDDLLAEGVSPQALDQVYAPLGIHIGSQTVPEIAVSICAELVAHRNLGAVPGRPEPVRQPGH